MRRRTLRGPNLTQREHDTIARMYVEHGAPTAMISRVIGRPMRTIQDVTALYKRERKERLDALERMFSGEAS